MARRAQKGGVKAALIGAGSAIVALGAAAAQDLAAEEAARLCKSKASLLKRHLDTQAVAAIENAGDEAARRAIAVARARLAAVNGDEDVAIACPEFDQALRVIASASAASSKSRGAGQDKAAYQQRYQQFSVYLKALSASPRSEWPTDLKRRFAQADLKFAEAGKYAADNRFDLANAAVETAYRDLLTVIKELNDGKLVVHQLVFKTPSDEFRYEQDRNRSYEMLLQIAISESPPPPELAAHVQRVIVDNSRRRIAAEQLSGDSDYGQAITEMEIASRELAKALRLVGVMVWD